MRHHVPRYVAPLSLACATLTIASTAVASPELPELTDHPRGSYVVVDPPPLSIDTPTQAGGGPHVLYLNRCAGGETISPGNENSSANTSSILNGAVNFPEFPYGDAAWNQVVERTRELYTPFNVQVTDVDPSPAPHDEVIVCGDGGSAGFGGAGGVAPFSCGVIPNAITFVFAQTMGNNPEAIAIVVGQESAHAWGLDHEYKCDDPMTYLNWCGDVQFQDGDYACGEYSERACSCGGNTQNSYQHIMGIFGPSTPDTQTPLAQIVSPTDGAEYDSGASFEIAVEVSDDIDVTRVTLFVNGESQASDESSPFGPWPASDTPDGTYEFYIEAEDFAGNVGQSDVITVHVGVDAPEGDTGDQGPDSESASDSDPGTDGDSDADTNADPDDDGSAGEVDEFDSDGALPPGFGGSGRGEAESCACTTSDTTLWSIAVPWLLVVGGAIRRRRART
jgi:hypothetical protein